MKNGKTLMDYNKIYIQLIERAKKRHLEGYKERHHITPRCLGGSDDIENLVFLTAREHFVAHLLLCKINPTHKGLRLALWMMSNVKDTKQQRYTPNSKLYEMIRLEYSESCSGKNNQNFGKILSLETKKKLSDLAKERKGYKNSFYGKTHSKETKEKIRKSVTGFKHSKETKEKMSALHKGKKKNNKLVICIYCNREGSGPNMTRYHFDNCKNK
jgi:hypothetical protein